MAKPSEPTPAEQGARQVRAVMISLMGSVVLAALLGGTPLMGALFWMAGFGFLWLSMSTGRAWARWIVVALAVLLGAGNAYQAVLLFGAEGFAWTINAGLVLVFGWCTFILVMSEKVHAFLHAKPDKPTPEE